MEPTPPEAREPDTPPDENQAGFVASFGFLMLILFGARWALQFIEDPSYKRVAVAALFVAILTFGALRALLVRALVVTLLLSAALVGWRHHEAWRRGRMSSGAMLSEVTKVALGFGPLDQARRLQGAAKYARYLSAFDDRDPDVKAKAEQIARGCAGDDDVCVARRIIEHVTTFDYRRDPVSSGAGQGDYVKSPRQTLSDRAGDCDDLSVVTASLASSVGLPAYLAFEEGHVYPFICVNSGRAPFVVEGHACFATEPTMGGSSLDVRKDTRKILAVMDPMRGDEVTVELRRP